MARGRDPTAATEFELEQVAREHDLALAMARLDAAADSARAAGRPLLAHAIRSEERELRARRRQLSHTVRVTRDRVACQFDDPGIGNGEEE